ncbi:MAG: hypothetical protein HC923_10655 [Myxococcales bacterium]|nr:hypothetical protein [Myxococcales bacterium]
MLTGATDVTERTEIQRRLLREEKEASLIAVAGGLAHDFNSILVGILSSVSMLQDEVGNSRNALELLDIIASASRRMADMTGKLLMYSRGAPFRPSEIELNHVVRDAVSMVRSSIPEKAALQLMLDERTILVRGDRAMLQQLVLSLLINAMEAVESKGSLISVETRASSDGVDLWVRDDGVGMTSDVCARIFEPFYSTKFQGRGLGLAAAAGIIETHGGDIRVETTPGVGTSFCVSLPGRVLEERPKQLVLLYDPDPFIRRLVQRLLKRTHLEVHDFEDDGLAKTALAAHGRDYVVALIDGIEGRTLLEFVRDRHAGLPIILMDSKVEPTHAPSGWTLRIEKPFDAVRLMEAIGQVTPAPLS